jgi:teichoic acid glycerol-phosphate primase
MVRGAAIVQPNSFHHVDHLAFFCDLFSIPLLVTDPKQKEITSHYYPFLSVQLVDPLELEIPALASSYDFVFHSFFWDKALLQKKLRAIYVPHGNSDKGHHQNEYLEKVMRQDISLLYGEQMVDLLKKKKVFDQVENYCLMGNVRHYYFLQKKSFFEKIVFDEIFSSLDPKKKTILYAPTWEDWEKSSSFFTAGEKLIEQLSEKFNLIVKLHPCLEIYSPAKTYRILGKYEQLAHVHFLLDFPYVYPLLEKTDIYVGDFSSIGYDFLTFAKPMFFLNPRKVPKKDPSRYLHQCGRELNPETCKNMATFIEKNLSLDSRYQQKRKETLLYAFGNPRKPEKIKQELLSLLELK